MTHVRHGRQVMVLAGGLSHERDVSLRSGRRVADALTRSGTETHIRDVDSTLLSAIRSSPPEVIWPVLHGATGEDGALGDLLGSLGIAYVGSSPSSCRLTWDKPVAKALVRPPVAIVWEEDTKVPVKPDTTDEAGLTAH